MTVTKQGEDEMRRRVQAGAAAGADVVVAAAPAKEAEDLEGPFPGVQVRSARRWMMVRSILAGRPEPGAASLVEQIDAALGAIEDVEIDLDADEAALVDGLDHALTHPGVPCPSCGGIAWKQVCDSTVEYWVEPTPLGAYEFGPPEVIDDVLTLSYTCPACGHQADADTREAIEDLIGA